MVLANMNGLTCPLWVNSPVLHTRKLRHRGSLPIIVDSLAESRNTPSHFKYSGTFFCFWKGRILTPKRACLNSANTKEEGQGNFEGGVKTPFRLHSERLRKKNSEQSDRGHGSQRRQGILKMLLLGFCQSQAWTVVAGEGGCLGTGTSPAC